MKVLFKSCLFLVLLTSCNAQQYSNIDHMTAELWAEDIDYVNKKINKEFDSFDPSIKDVFSKNAEGLKSELPQLSNEEIAIKMGWLLASLKDGHTEMNVLQSGANLDRLPVALYFFEDGLYIFAAHESYQDLIGMRVMKMGTLAISDSIERLKSVMTYDNDYEILHAGPRFLVVPDILKYLGAIESTSEATLTLVDNSGQEIEKKVQSVTQNTYGDGPWKTYNDLNGISPLLRDKNNDRNYWYEYLKDQNTIYLCLNRMNNQKGQASIKKTVSKLFEDIDQIKPQKLVIDIRRNTGGNYNLSRPLIEEIKDRNWLNQDGKIFVLNGRTTFSAAMVTSIFLKRETAAILVGEPSRGHPNKCDNNEYMTLPNSGLSIEYTTKVEKHWPELGDATFVPIDVEIPHRFSDYKDGKDGTLEYVLQQ
ncbi:MAG: hypothetical protein KJO50_04305 [Bacteroidia bacterium]|nr:hypothetical protein [Bacteroidia bacterium]